jgi:HEAT repeat protein
MSRHGQQGQANLTAIAVLVGLIVTGVWVWKRLPLDVQEYVIDQALPVSAVALILGTMLLTVVRKARRRIRRREERERLIAAFQREVTPDKKLQLSFAVTELNGYRVEGLEPIVPALRELWVSTLRRAVGEKQYLIRGMAASHLGVLQDKTVVPLLMKALEDDHAYVRSCAALGLGRLRAIEARARLVTVMEEDWDQTVRSRAKEAVERLRV